MRYQGKISNWKDDQGFGFIKPNKGGTQVFVHIKSFSNRYRRPVDNEIVTYEVKSDHKGRQQAELVAFIDEVPLIKSTRNNKFLLALAPLFLIIIATYTYIAKLPFVIIGLYLAVSGLTFIIYYFDKSAAKKDSQRTPEKTLHILALLGGWPGALVAQQLFRHKSKKAAFQRIFWLTVFVNCALLGWLITHTNNPKVLLLMHLI